MRLKQAAGKAGVERLKPLFIWGVGALVIALVIGFTRGYPGLVSNLGNQVFDRYQQLKPRPESRAPITIVDIDAASLKQIGQWPWSRITLARLVNRLGGLGASAIAFDMVFAEPDRSSPARIVARLRKQGAHIEMPTHHRILDSDRVLAHAFATNPVVAGLALTRANAQSLPPPKAGISFSGVDPKRYLPAFSGGVTNLAALSQAASGLGFFSFPASKDGVVRSVPVVGRAQGHLYPALSVEALRVAQGAQSFFVHSTRGMKGGNGYAAMTAFTDGRFSMPTGPDGQFRVWYSPLAHMQTISAATLLDSKPDAESEKTLENAISDHIILIGTSAVGLRDLVSTPLEAATPGVRVHAQIIDQIIGQAFLSQPDWAPGAELALAIGLALILLLVESWFGPLVNTATAATLVVLAIVVSWLAFSRLQLLLNPVVPVAAVVLAFALTTPVLLLLANRERQFIQSAFARYLSPALVGRLADNPQALRLGGENRDLTVLFSDIRGFTSLSENLDADALTRLLNDFLTPATDVLLAREATIDKYIGDAIMAFWNAPLDIDDHRRKACMGALDMRHALAELNARHGLSLRVGVGLNAGECCVGNLGSAQRFSYSAIGDDVNLASRIEGLTKQYGVDILVSESVQDGAPDLAFIEADRVQVVGRHVPTRIYVLVGDTEHAASAEFQDYAAAHDAFLTAFRGGDADRASDALARARALAPAEFEKLYDKYAGRVADLAANGPGDGDVFVADEK